MSPTARADAASVGRCWRPWSGPRRAPVSGPCRRESSRKTRPVWPFTAAAGFAWSACASGSDVRPVAPGETSACSSEEAPPIRRLSRKEEEESQERADPNRDPDVRDEVAVGHERDAQEERL